MESKKKVVTNIMLAAEVARDVQLDSIVLRRASLEALADGDEVDVPRLLDIGGLESKMQVASRGSIDKTRLVVTMNFVADMQLAEPDKRTVLHLEAEYALRYRVPEGKTYRDVAVRYFAEVNGAINVWPYWRELVHTVAARVGLGALTLPVYRAQSRAVDEEPTEKPSQR